jgi:hypothetical protein
MTAFLWRPGIAEQCCWGRLRLTGDRAPVGLGAAARSPFMDEMQTETAEAWP